MRKEHIIVAVLLVLLGVSNGAWLISSNLSEVVKIDVSGWLQLNFVALGSLLITVVLVLINVVYVYYTKKTLDAIIRQSNLSHNPVIGIHINNMKISKVFGPSRRQLSVGLLLVNIGNSPAIEVLVDAEMRLQYSSINGEKVIPSRTEPSSAPFIRQGEELKDDPMISPNFGNTCVTHLLDDFRECHRLNTLRIETDPTKESYEASRLKIIVYYKNNVGQYFMSAYETNLHLEEIPKENETADLTQIYIPRPVFCSGPIQKEQMDKEISERNKKRDLCGW